MTLIIDLTPEQEASLNGFARRSGLAPEEMTKRLVVDNLPEATQAERFRRESVMRELVAETERLGLYE